MYQTWSIFITPSLNLAKTWVEVLWCDETIRPGVKLLQGQRSDHIRWDVVWNYGTFLHFTWVLPSLSVLFPHTESFRKLRFVLSWLWRSTWTRSFFSLPSAKMVCVNLNSVKAENSHSRETVGSMRKLQPHTRKETERKTRSHKTKLIIDWLCPPPRADILSQHSGVRGWGRGSQVMILTVGNEFNESCSRQTHPPDVWRMLLWAWTHWKSNK